MTFSEQMIQKIASLMLRINTHPFIQELKSGELSPHVFGHYIEQDSYYLTHYSKALALLAARSHESAHIEAFLDFSKGALIAEKEGVHDIFRRKFNVAHSNERTFACLAYVHFLRSTCALDPIEVAAAAILPCFWIYHAVGITLTQNHSLPTHHPYLPWLEVYGGEDFAKGVSRACTIVDQLAAAASPHLRMHMESAFLMSAQLEWHFWDDAYHQRWIGHHGAL